MTITTTARNAGLQDLVSILRDQHARKIDVVAPAAALRAKGGIIHVQGTEVQLTEDGVTTTAGAYLPTDVFDRQLAEKLDMPVKYLRRMRTEAVDLYDANVNGWLHGCRQRIDLPTQTTIHNAREVDTRSFLFRGFRGGDGTGVARALLSDSYGITDHLDVLTAVLDGVRQSGVEVEVTRCDLTESRMYVAVNAPAVAALAPTLLAGYRSPFSGASGDENPTVFAGFVISNSEVGTGAFTLTPRLTVEVCTNGMTMTKDAMRAIHLGGKLDHGIVRWSEDTQRKNLDVVTAKARDAVATFLDTDYVTRCITELERNAGVPVTNAFATVEHVGKRLAFTEAQITGVLDHFIRGGQLTAGGVMQAVTSYAQTVDSADTAYELEAAGVAALDTAALFAAAS